MQLVTGACHLNIGDEIAILGSRDDFAKVVGIRGNWIKLNYPLAEREAWRNIADMGFIQHYGSGPHLTFATFRASQEEFEAHVQAKLNIPT